MDNSTKDIIVREFKAIVVTLLVIIGIVLIIFSITYFVKESFLKSEINTLKVELNALNKEIGIKNRVITQFNNQLKNKEDALYFLNEEIKRKNILVSGQTIKYIIKFSLRQSHFSLDLMTHLKDYTNEALFEIEVSEQYYNSVKEGQVITDEFRIGSAILSGSFGNWVIRVESKRGVIVK